MNQKMLISTSLTPNILMHVFSCLEIEGSFYNSDYGLKHHFTLLESDYEKWQELAKKCMTINCNAELYAVLFQIPSYIPADDIETVIDSLDKILEAINQGSIDVLLDNYPEIFDSLFIYAPKEVFNTHFKRLNKHKKLLQEIFQSFQKMLLGLWERFYFNYWENDAKKKLEKKIKALYAIVLPTNIIYAWQQIFKFEFPYNEFNVILVEPTSILATNLLGEKIITSSLNEDKDIYKIIIHEIGRSYLLNTRMFENEKLKSITLSNSTKLSLIVDAVCIYFKKNLFKTFKIRTDELDPYEIPEVKSILIAFKTIWESMKEKDIYEALIQTYNKITPIV